MRDTTLSPETRQLWADLLRSARATKQEARRLAAEPGAVVLVRTRRHDGAPMGAVITPEPTAQGSWRCTWFDEDGFSGHTVRQDKAEAILLALREGYADTDRDLLRRLSKAERFRCGPAMGEG